MTRLDRIRQINPELTIYTVHDVEFAAYGRVVEGVDVSELLGVAETYAPLPRPDFVYETSVPCLEALDASRELSELCWGGMDTQVGLGRGNSHSLDALEWHTCGETSIAVTDMIMLLADRRDIKDGWLDSGSVRAFYLARGEVIDIFATTLHYCPAEVDTDGIRCIVILQKGTNEPLGKPSLDPLLFAKNKWLFAHEDCADLLAQGVVPGIRGVNLTLKSFEAR